MDSAGLKKFAAEAGSFFNRAKQFTEEKLGQAEKTELDAHFENLLLRSDRTKYWTEQILSQSKTCLQPNPSARVEEFVWDKLGQKKKEISTDSELLGQYMLDAGNEFGPGTSYGSALIKCGQTHQKMGLAERDLVASAANNFVQPLRAFLDGDMKTVMKERRLLEGKRLDLDACKSRLKRAKSQSSKDNAEADLRVAQAEFDRQVEITKLLLEGINSTHEHHLRCLYDFIESEATYYAQCAQYMKDLQRQLGSVGGGMMGSGPSLGGTSSPSIHAPLSFSDQTNNEFPENSENGQKAQVLYDYDAAGMKELSLVADEVIEVHPLEGESNWMMGYRGNQKGLVPITYLQIIK